MSLGQLLAIPGSEIQVVAVMLTPDRHVEWVLLGRKLFAMVPVQILDPSLYLDRHFHWLTHRCSDD